jgi:hypothetical protein
MDNKSQLYGVEEPQLYGVDAGARKKTLGEKLREAFKADDFVRVINIDDELFTWQALDPSDESYYTVPGPQKNTVRGLPKLFTLQPGETTVLPGWNAYLMIENLYKKVSAKDRIARKTPSQQADPKYVTSFVWDDEKQQDSYIARIFVGVEQPQFSNASSPKVNTAPVEIAQPKTIDELQQPLQHQTETVDDIAIELGLKDEPANSTR